MCFCLHLPHVCLWILISIFVSNFLALHYVTGSYDIWNMNPVNRPPSLPLGGPICWCADGPCPEHKLPSVVVSNTSSGRDGVSPHCTAIGRFCHPHPSFLHWQHGMRWVLFCRNHCKDHSFWVRHLTQCSVSYLYRWIDVCWWLGILGVGSRPLLRPVYLDISILNFCTSVFFSPVKTG